MRNSIFPAFFLNLSNHLFEITFYVAVLAVLLLIVLFTYQLMTDVIEFYRLKQTGRWKFQGKFVLFIFQRY
jgi:hypothetical protein